MDAAEDLLRQLTTPSPAAKGGRGKADLLQTFGQDIDIALADSRSPTSFRNMVVKCVAVLGSENSDPHALVRWSFDRLFNNRPYLRAKDGEKELRMMILALLLEFVEIISSRPSPRNDEVIGRVLTDMQIFVDTMETADYMPKTLDLFQLLAEKYPNQLEKSFKDIVDLLVGWSIDPSLSRNIAALIADTFKKLWRFWMLHVTFSLELARHLLSDIEVLVGLQCGPDAPGSGEVSLSQTSGRTSRLPANAFILVRCLQSVMYVLTYAGFQNMNVDCEIPIGANVEVFESYRETVRWCLQLSAAVGAKYEDRTWLAQGLGFVKFLSKALQAEFSPYQELSLDILMLDCRLFAREYIGEQNYATSVEKEIIDWLAVLEEITDDWLPYLSIAVLPYFTVTSFSPLLNSFRWVALRCSTASSALRKLLTKMIATAQLPTPANEDANPLNQLEELVHEIVDLSCLLVSGEDEDLFCNAIRDPWSENGSYKAHMALVNELEASDQWLILADDIELLTVVTQTDAFSFGVLPLFRILTALTPLVKTSTHWRIVIHERVVLASYTLAERENFFLFGVSIEDLPGVIAMHLHALRFAMDLVDVRYNEGLIVYAWIRDLVLALIEEGDGGTPVASLLDRRTFESLSERTSRMGSMLAKELDPEVRVYMAHAWSAWVDLLLCIEKLGNVHDTRRQVREVLEVARQRVDDPDPTVRTAYHDILVRLLPSWILSNSVVNSWPIDASQTIHEGFMAALPSGMFRARHFQVVLTYLGMQGRILRGDEPPPPTMPDHEDLTWLETLLSSCRHIDSANSDVILSSKTLLFWALWESARYCILSRLRTPLGSPRETFEALEGCLKESVAALLTLPADISEAEAATHTRIKTQVQELQHLLTFIDLLEVQVRNASDGSLQCAQAPKASIAFFYTNKKSCEEWFARVRKSLIQAARVAGASTMLVKHSLQFLRENVDPRGEPALKERNLVPADTETVLRDLVDELTALQDPDTLTGIGQWLDEIGLTKRDDMDIPAQQITLLKRSAAPASQSDATFCLPWSKAYRLLAEHRFEDALPLLKRSRDALSKMTGTNLERTQPIDGWLQRQIVDSYVQLEDWSALQHWLTETRQSAAVSTLPSYMLGRNATTLSAWQMLDVPQLEEDKGVVFPKVANIAYLLHLGYPTACLRISEASVIQGILGKDVINLVDSDVRGLLRNALACTTGGDTNREHDLILHAGFEPQLLAPFCGDGSPFDDIPKSSCSALNLLLHVCRRQARLSADGDMPAPLRSLQFLVARTARKNRNFAFATRMTERDDAGRTETYEYAKLEYSRGKRRQGIATLLDSLKEDSKQEESPQSAARILVRLARWITTSATDIRLASSLVNDLEAVCSGAEPDTPVQSFPEKTNNLDDLAQHLLLKATVCAPDDAKAWFRYAGHCYKAGRRALDMATVLSGDKYGAQAALRDLVSPLIPKGSSDEGFKQLLGLIHDELRRPGLTGIDVPDSLFDRSLKKTFPELKLEQALPICAHVQEIKRSILGYLRLAAVSYFRYLQVVGSSSGLPAESQRFAVATLRTADVFLLYPALRDTLVPHFQVTPVGPWEGIVPQLYARMDHPDLLARTTIMTLVRRIGAASPQLTVYSALADTPMTAEATGVPSPTILQALQNDGAAPLVLQVQELLGELKRITVLWEESWLHKLAHVHGDAAKRLERIEGEMNRVRRSPSLSDSEKDRLVREYYHTIMKPLVNLLEKLQVTTSCGPESTPHEKWFEHTYQSRIDGALTALREPDDITNPKNAWEPFKALYADLSHELQRSRELKLADVSPVLANFRGSVIPMPGLLDKFITIDSFTDAFHVLPSKTKPKKLQLMGSDGQKYTYLFKGMEDLHMDERVQQLLRLINQFLDQDKPSRGRHLRARSYAVIPCGQRFGMIQWVEDVTPFFTLFKRWQQRDYSARLLQRQESDKEPVPAPLRPHEQFYGRMGPALKRQGLSSKTPRRDWPQVAMRETLQLLERETPSDLVSRELFCASPSATAWWDKTKAFGRSTAVMSMIGYMIGLGDRHLDNILLDQHSGELVHIDFNVCFENGFKLRVPETVPFRLTQNIRSALGVTGTHGVFRIASENVLRVMRDNRETLLTLLEAFVYDPLVDWTRNASEDVDKRRLELNVNIGVLASRVAEKRDAIESTIQDMLKACDEVHRLLAENFPCSPLRKASFVDPTLPRPQQVGEARDLIARRRSECEMWATRHSRALLSLQGPVLQACASEACSPETVGCFPPIAPATFMMGPSEWQMARCVEFDQELFRIGKQKVLCYQRCLEHLQLYQSIAAPIAEQLLQQDRFVLWPTLLNSLLGPPGLDPSADAFAKVFGGPTEENLTEHTRKAALEAVMKSICSFKDEELEAARQSLEGKSSSPSQLDTDIELTSALADPERGQMLAQCISLQHLAQVGHLLYVAIKDPAQIATIEGDLASVIRASTAELTSLYRTKRAYQPLLYETKAMVSVAMVSAVLLQVDSTDVNGLPVTNIKNYGDLSSNLCSIHWHLTEVLLPEVMQILATNHPSTMQALLSELEVITKPFADGNLDQTSSNFQDAATKLSREFKSLCSKWASRTHKAVHSVLSTCDMMFAPVLAGVESVSQSDSADFKIIQNVLVVYQVLFIVEIVAACQSYIPGSEMDVDDPTNEWTAVFDFNDIVLEHEAFSKAIVTLRKFVDVCLREVIMKPLAKLVAKTIKRCAGGGKVEAATELQSPTGIPFVDAAWSALDCKLKSVPEHTAWYELGLNSAVLRRDAMLADAERLEGMAILSRYHARAHRRRLALSRYQLLHEAALTYPSRRAGAFLSPTPRLRFIGSIGDDLPVLMQLSNDMVNLDRNYMILTEELEPLLQACSDAPAVETFRELRAVRFQQIKIEIGRVTSMIELCNTLVHFETFRVPSPSTNALDEDILNSVRGLQLVIEGPSDSLPIKMSANVARTIADKIDALSAIYDDTGKILQDIHQVVEALVFTSQNLAVARGLREDLQEHLRRWSGIGALVQMHRLTVERLSDNSLDPNDVPALRSTLLELQSKAEHLLKSTCAFASLSELDHGSADRDVPVDHAALASPMQASLRPETPRAEPLAFSSEALYVDDENEQTLLVAMDAKQSSGIVPDNFGFMEPARTPDDIVILRQSDANASELSLEDGHATGQQERNAYGLGVLRRIKDKLDGKDNAERRKMSVSEQVDKVTQEALDPKRIAAMYEGWMAWI